MCNLSDMDLKILDYVSRKGPVHIDEIKTAFRKVPEIEYRITELSQQDMSSSGSCWLPNSSYIHQRIERAEPSPFSPEIETGMYEITDLGRTTLRDCKTQRKNQIKKMCTQGVWLPLTVSLLTTIATYYILPKLPQILKWCSDFLSKIL